MGKPIDLYFHPLWKTMYHLQAVRHTLLLLSQWLRLESSRIFPRRGSAGKKNGRHLALFAWALPPNSFSLDTVVLRVGSERELMNETLRIAEDYEFWVRLSRNHRFACLNRPQASYVLHNTDISYEAAGSAADNAPLLLDAYHIMLSYPALEKKQIRIIQENMAEVLFSWAYRCRKQRQWRNAGRLHLRSFRLGKRRENAAALLKLLLVSLFPALESQGR